MPFSPDPCLFPSTTPLVLLDNDTYSSFGPTSNEMDRAVIQAHPQWDAFRQELFHQSLTIGDVFEQAAFGGPEYGVNPAILLIAVNMRLDWQVPGDGDMFLRAEQAAREMFPHYVAFYTEETVRRANPSIGNASTYSLYRFFGQDLSTLHQWCTIYQEMFGVDYPLR